EDEELIKAESKNVAKIDIHGSGSQTTDPEVKQSGIAQDAVKQLQSKSTVRRAQFRFRQQREDDRMGEAFFRAPRSHRGKRGSASRQLRHAVSPL
ncbi:MAG TPA: hypothetical protein VGW97_02215, partial [Chthoniobacterales bacterium]|nr:hypothetical protein [Chthoniobacterales bacterium]